MLVVPVSTVSLLATTSSLKSRTAPLTVAASMVVVPAALVERTPRPVTLPWNSVAGELTVRLFAPPTMVFSKSTEVVPVRVVDCASVTPPLISTAAPFTALATLMLVTPMRSASTSALKVTSPVVLTVAFRPMPSSPNREIFPEVELTPAFTVMALLLAAVRSTLPEPCAESAASTETLPFALTLTLPLPPCVWTPLREMALTSSMRMSPEVVLVAVSVATSVSRSIPVAALAFSVAPVTFVVAPLSSIRAPVVLVRFTVWPGAETGCDSVSEPVLVSESVPPAVTPLTPPTVVTWSAPSLVIATPPAPPVAARRSTSVCTASGAPIPVAALASRSGATIFPSPSRMAPAVDSSRTQVGLVMVPRTAKSPGTVTMISGAGLWAPAVGVMSPSPRTPGPSR